VYGLAEDTDLGFLIGAELLQVSVGSNEVIFRFDKEISITVEAEFLISSGGIETRFDDAPGAASAAAGLLRETVVGSRVLSGGTLSLQLSGDKGLTMFDSSTMYESYQIHHGQGSIIV
jgi:hypothetical protein